MTASPTVLVVGGGATGAGVARDLALRGVDVTLVERGGLGSGTSGRSHGLLHSGARYAESDPDGARECIRENRILTRIAGACVRETGGLFVRLPSDDRAYFETKRAACEEIGIPADVVDGDAARSVASGLSPDVDRAMRVPDGVVFPSRLVAANAADARANGGRVHTNAPVEDVQVSNARITGVEVGGEVDDVLEPDFVVNATGAWAKGVAAMAGVEVPMRPTRGVMVAVEYEGVGPVLNRARAPADGDIVVPHDRTVVLGTTSVAVDDPDEYPKEDWEIERTVSECAAMLPAVADAPISRTWWGVRPLYEPDEAERDERGISRDFFLLDHADGARGPSGSASVPDRAPGTGVENFATVVGGKLTTYRAMAEATTDLVCDRLGIDAACITDERRLPGADSPARLDEFVAAFDGQGPTDADVVDAPGTPE